MKEVEGIGYGKEGLVERRGAGEESGFGQCCSRLALGVLWQ